MGLKAGFLRLLHVTLIEVDGGHREVKITFRGVLHHGLADNVLSVDETLLARVEVGEVHGRINRAGVLDSLFECLFGLAQLLHLDEAVAKFVKCLSVFLECGDRLLKAGKRFFTLAAFPILQTCLVVAFRRARDLILGDRDRFRRTFRLDVGRVQIDADHLVRGSPEEVDGDFFLGITVGANPDDIGATVQIVEFKTCVGAKETFFHNNALAQ